jgi:hypothetical protein
MKVAASFRDPSGFLFQQAGVLYRQVNKSYKTHYDMLMKSGLYERLVKGGILIPHQEAHIKPPEPTLAYKVIKPEPVRFISYPYEWGFQAFKDAALVTLRLHYRALEFDMVLKDASAYNIQIHKGRMRLIDTLSFEKYKPGEPWVAYKQFCQHFLAPLALMAYQDVRISQLMRVYIDGIPLDLAVKLLPLKARMNLSLLSHIYLHANAQAHYADSGGTKSASISKNAMLALIDSLESTVKKLQLKDRGTEWADYYDITNYSEAAFEEKKKLVGAFISQCKPQAVWDLGGNTGVFSRLASDKGIFTVSFDIDPNAVNENYSQMRANKEQSIVPLVLDLTNPSAGIGWENNERESFMQRAPTDLVMALALVHHLAISNNVPLAKLADFFHKLGKWLIIEFVPKSDSQVEKLLSSREDIFIDYDEKGFETAFKPYFEIKKKAVIKGTKRSLYLMAAKKK